LRKQWEGEGSAADSEPPAMLVANSWMGAPCVETLTRLAALATLSRNAGEGQSPDFVRLLERVQANGARRREQRALAHQQKISSAHPFPGRNGYYISIRDNREVVVSWENRGSEKLIPVVTCRSGMTCFPKAVVRNTLYYCIGAPPYHHAPVFFLLLTGTPPRTSAPRSRAAPDWIATISRSLRPQFRFLPGFAGDSVLRIQPGEA